MLTKLIRCMTWLVAILALLSIPAFADFTFVQVSDTHIAAGGKDPAYTSRYEEAIRQINILNPAFVIHTGDALGSFSDASYAKFKQLSSKLKPKMYIVPGNHDVGRKSGLEDPITSKSHGAWVKAAGYDRLSFEQEGWFFIGLDSSLFNSGLPEEKEQLDWLKAQLGSAGKKHVIVFQHCPMFEVTPKDANGGYFNIDEPMRSKLIDLFAKHKVEAVLCGHVHKFNESRYKGINFIATPALSFSVTGDAGLTGYRVFRVTPDAFTTYFIDMRTGGTPPEFGK